MLVRDCTGGIVFYEDKVLMLENNKHEWVFPKGVVRKNQKMTDVVIERVKVEAGIDAKILAPCGKTHYEYYSVSRMKPVHNNVSWFIMKALSSELTPNSEQDFVDAKFYEIEEAMKTITYSQDKSLLLVAYQKYKELTFG
ncbi:MAG: NUDIX domain-containing protein [Saccharofermentans sp.]|nr:NUDIX domain-containing protein [Saccharofermentans sp.]